MWIRACLLAVLVAGAAGYGRTLTVDDDGPADYDSIQQAVNHADDGDTIRVAAGTYNEQVYVLHKQQIHLVGDGADVTTIGAPGEGHTVCYNTASGSVRGFTLTHAPSPYAPGAGVFTSQSQVDVIDNIIMSNFDGVRFSSLSSGTIQGNRIVLNDGDGIRLMGSGAVIRGNLIARNDWMGINGSSDTQTTVIESNTVARHPSFGVYLTPQGPQTIRNNIISENKYGIFVTGRSESGVGLCEIAYNNVWGNEEANYWEEYGMFIVLPGGPRPGDGVSRAFVPLPGTGEISMDPLFAKAFGWDCHLKSQAGRYDPAEGRWVIDSVTSPCIDAGDPMKPLGPEPFPNGGVLNMGAYGGTAEASKSYFGTTPCATIVAGDINGDCAVNLLDISILARHWCEDHNP